MRIAAKHHHATTQLSQRLSLALLTLLLALTCLGVPLGCTASTPSNTSEVSTNTQPTDSTTSSEKDSESTTDTSSEPSPSSTPSPEPASQTSPNPPSSSVPTDITSLIPQYNGAVSITINDNIPFFTSDELVVGNLETYSPLDSLGRCGVALACIGTETMPTEERKSIGDVRPSGWVMAKYDCVDGKYLYNRCHLIGFQLAGENANPRNLITGTRYFNVDGMLPYENMVADYVERTSAHVLYRVTPIFEGQNLVANGVLIEARSIEDSGVGICFNVFVYNIQPHITIDYATGESSYNGSDGSSDYATNNQPATNSGTAQTYILNTRSHKFHYPECSSVDSMSEKNKEEVIATRDELIAEGYDPCGRCNP